MREYIFFVCYFIRYQNIDHTICERSYAIYFTREKYILYIPSDPFYVRHTVFLFQKLLKI